jgi:mannose-1-phosphate guanylyltransferase
MNAAMVLAAGLGTRLRPLTDLVPKPLVPLGDRPMLAEVVSRLRAAACVPVVANAFHGRGALAAWCEGAGVLVSDETDLLGTAGGIGHAAALLGAGDVLVHNGDVLADVDLTGLLKTHAQTRASATLAVVPLASGGGNVGVDDTGRIVRLRKETFAPGETRGGEFAGIHMVSADVRAMLPARGCIVGDVYMPLLRAGGVLRDYPAASLVDVGTPAGYLDANLAWLARKGLPAFVAPDAQVASGVTLDRTIVGRGARIEGHGALVGCVVWPGATARAPAVDTIFACSLDAGEVITLTRDAVVGRGA